MAAHFIIQLQGIRFFGEHGMYEEERQVGNEFELNLSVEIKAPKKSPVSLEDTVNYVEIYRIAEEVFSERKQLLETCAMEIAEKLHEQFPEILKVDVSIKKIKPPITNFSGSVAVSFTRTFK